MEITVKIANLDKIRSALAKSPVTVSKHINKAINRSILDIRNSAMDTTPVDKGTLRGSYQMTFGNLRGELYPTAKYAMFVHEGHRQTPGRFVPAIGKRLVQPYVKGNPFLKKAITNTTRKINDNFNDGLKDSLNEIARSV